MSQKISITCSFDVFESENSLNESDRNLLSLAKKTMNNAYAPYSDFHVGAAVLLENGAIVTGSNQENAAYPSGLCAERVAVFQASSLYPNVKIMAIAVSARSGKRAVYKPVSPCGACRQSVSEYEARFQQPIRVIMSGETGEVYISPSVSNLLPLTFTFQNL